jgi:hypothetical protein
MEDVVREVLSTILLAELGLMVALLLAWRAADWLLGPRGVTRALASCPNCGWQRVAAAQICPLCRLAPEDSYHVPPAR